VDELPSQIAFAGDSTTMTLTNVDMSNIQVGEFKFLAAIDFCSVCASCLVLAVVVSVVLFL
jgi:hypothetical protein